MERRVKWRKRINHITKAPFDRLPSTLRQAQDRRGSGSSTGPRERDLRSASTGERTKTRKKNFEDVQIVEIVKAVEGVKLPRAHPPLPLRQAQGWGGEGASGTRAAEPRSQIAFGAA